MQWRKADPDHDVEVLARLNKALIRDQGHHNPMNLGELEERMRGWLRGAYTAVIFVDGRETLGYALFRDHEYGRIHVRQFFVVSEYRRQGVGTRAFQVLRSEVLHPDVPIVLDVVWNNTAGMAFWESLGFEDYSRRLQLRPK